MTWREQLEDLQRRTRPYRDEQDRILSAIVRAKWEMMERVPVKEPGAPPTAR